MLSIWMLDGIQWCSHTGHFAPGEGTAHGAEAIPGIEPLLNGCMSVVEFSGTRIERIYFVIVRCMCKRWQHNCMETVLPPNSKFG